MGGKVLDRGTEAGTMCKAQGAVLAKAQSRICYGISQRLAPDRPEHMHALTSKSMEVPLDFHVLKG